MDNNLTIIKGIPDEVRKEFGDNNISILKQLHKHFGGKMWVTHFMSAVPIIVMDCPNPPDYDTYLSVLHTICPETNGDDEWELAYVSGDGFDDLGKFKTLTYYEVEED